MCIMACIWGMYYGGLIPHVYTLYIQHNTTPACHVYMLFIYSNTHACILKVYNTSNTWAYIKDINMGMCKY